MKFLYPEMKALLIKDTMICPKVSRIEREVPLCLYFFNLYLIFPIKTLEFPEISEITTEASFSFSRDIPISPTTCKNA